MMKKIIHQAIILSLVLSSHALAQQQDLWTNFTIADGLANNDVDAIVQSSDGALWFATRDGVSRYQDGIWTTFTTADGLASNIVDVIFESSDGALWFGTLSEGVSRYQNGKWQTFTKNDGLAHNRVAAIFESENGALWFGTGGGVSRYRNGIWRTFTTADGLVHNYVTAIAQDSDGAMWFGTAGGGASRLKSGSWAKFTFYCNYVEDILVSSDSTLWFATCKGVLRYKDGIVTTFIDELGNELVWSILESSDGAIWFGTSGGASSYQNGLWQTLTIADGLVGDWVNAIIECNDGALWFGTGSGVSRYEQSIWTTITKADDGLVSNYVHAILETKDGALWFGTEGGASRYQNGLWTTFDVTNGLVRKEVYSILESSDSTLWFGTLRGASRFQNGIWTTIDFLALHSIRAIFESRDGALWFGTGGGVHRFQGSAWTAFHTKNSGLVHNNVLAIVESGDGAMWFGTPGGVSRFENGNWTTFDTSDGLPVNSVHAILEASNRALWFGTNGGGASRFQDGIWTTFSSADGLAGNSVGTIIESRDGALWFATEGGVSRFQDGIWTTFTTADGLAGSVSAMIESSDRAMWFGTFSGGVNRLKPDSIPPFTSILEGPESLIGIPAPLFRFDGRDFRTKPEELYFSYAIVDTSIIPGPNHWSPLTKRTVIQADFLNNGTYTFHVRARDAWGNLDPTPAKRTFTVDITPPTVTIISPKPEEVLFGKVVVIGSAFDTSPIRDFAGYQIDYSGGVNPTQIDEWRRIASIPAREIRNDTLAIWDTQGLNGPFWLRLSANDSLGHESQDVVKINIVTASQLIDRNQGSRLKSESGNVEIYVPPRAVPRDVQLNVSACSTEKFVPLDDPQIISTGLCFSITPADLDLSKPATLTLTYADSLLAGKNERSLAIFYFPDGQGNWQRLGGSINAEENKITTSFSRGGVYALYEDTNVGGAAGIANVNIGPRVFSPYGTKYSSTTNISFELGKQATVTIKVFNVAGRLVCSLKENELMNRGANVVSWNGRDDSGGACVSGLYTVVIRADGRVQSKTVMVLNN
jgi:ligand-binding sensor domain-containing protein